MQSPVTYTVHFLCKNSLLQTIILEIIFSIAGDSWSLLSGLHIHSAWVQRTVIPPLSPPLRPIPSQTSVK